jgi:hypothetical protein
MSFPVPPDACTYPLIVAADIEAKSTLTGYDTKFAAGTVAAPSRMAVAFTTGASALPKHVEDSRLAESAANRSALRVFMRRPPVLE